MTTASRSGGDDESVEARLIAHVRGGSPGAREVYADWLESRGRLDRATFMRRDDPEAALLDLVSWLHDVGDLDDDFDLGLLALGCLAFGLRSGFPVLPGARVTMVARPQAAPVVPVQIVISEIVAARFDIVDISIGNRGQLMTAGPIPASMFTPSAIAGHRCRIALGAVSVAQDFRIEVQNVGDVECDFRAVVFCRSCDDPTERSAAPAPPRPISPDDMAEIVARVRAAVEIP